MPLRERESDERIKRRRPAFPFSIKIFVFLCRETAFKSSYAQFSPIWDLTSAACPDRCRRRCCSCCCCPDRLHHRCPRKRQLTGHYDRKESAEYDRFCGEKMGRRWEWESGYVNCMCNISFHLFCNHFDNGIVIFVFKIP